MISNNKKQQAKIDFYVFSSVFARTLTTTLLFLLPFLLALRFFTGFDSLIELSSSNTKKPTPTSSNSTKSYASGTKFLKYDKNGRVVKVSSEYIYSKDNKNYDATNVKLEMFLSDTETAVVNSDNGNFSSNSNIIKLENNVVLETSEGKRFLTEEIFIDSKSQRFYTEEHVTLIDNVGNLEAVGLESKNDNKDFLFKKNVHLVHLETLDQSKNPSSPEVQRSQETIVTSDNLYLDTKKQIAHFAGNVVIKKDNIIITCDKADAFYSSAKEEPSKSTQGTPANIKKEVNSSASSIEKIELYGNVTIKDPEQTAKSKFGVYSGKDSLMTLTGSVVIVRSDGNLTGDRFVYDMISRKGTISSNSGERRKLERMYGPSGGNVANQTNNNTSNGGDKDAWSQINTIKMEKEGQKRVRVVITDVNNNKQTKKSDDLKSKEKE